MKEYIWEPLFVIRDGFQSKDVLKLNLKTLVKRIKKAMANLFFSRAKTRAIFKQVLFGIFLDFQKKSTRKNGSSFFLMRYQSRFVSIMDSSTRERKVTFSAILKQRDDRWHGSVWSFCFSSRGPKTLRDAKLIWKIIFLEKLKLYFWDCFCNLW